MLRAASGARGAVTFDLCQGHLRAHFWGHRKIPIYAPNMPPKLAGCKQTFLDANKQKKPPNLLSYGAFSLFAGLLWKSSNSLVAEEAGLSNNPFLSNKINDLHSWVMKLVAKFDTRFATR